ncbi:MAG: hypothetical protein ABTS16_00465 [Candidatus Accumulibacter phosphatis]|jgi:hypothetical protein|uniref:Uncharacterized protein n=1 Tax=Candidatus Accumulibacter contiguus TaxID=2954381 RepID=A0ABX1T312_9PROT|nr:hypothetical protein [Candidatus Accumulibacter contiguus]NMQ04028.1 hypothetical protein [Candidatus Accumulibacter contiguus]
MNKRRLLNLPASRQSELRLQYPWLKEVHEGERPKRVQVLSVTVFDHWLSREEACDLLENISPAEQARRDALHAKFCALLVASTTVFSFVFRRRQKDRLVFREFTSASALANYCSPRGGRMLGHRQFYVALPELDCVFYESWDDTNHFFFTKPTAMGAISEWATQSGLYVLQHG